jgi:hypothetical protein
MNWYKKARYGGAEKERSIWYHGTRGKNLQKILSEGLIISPKQKSWQEDPNASLYGASKASLGGIYLTQNLMTARSSAIRGKDKKEDMIIVIVEAQPRSFVMDEDNISATVQNADASNYPSAYLIGELYMANFYKTNEEFVNVRKNEYITEAMYHINKRFKISSQIQPHIKQIISDGWIKALNRQASYIPKDEWRSCFYRNIPNTIDNDLRLSRKNMDDKEYTNYVNSLVPQQPNSGIAEKEYAEYVDKLTKALKSSARPINQKDTFNLTARNLDNIGFSGSNKIIGIVAAKPDHTAQKIYGQIPEKFIKDWESAVGKLEWV